MSSEISYRGFLQIEVSVVRMFSARPLDKASHDGVQPQERTLNVVQTCTHLQNPSGILRTTVFPFRLTAEGVLYGDVVP